MLLESDPKPLGEDVAVRIPPVDDGKFVNRLTDKGKSDPAKASPRRSDAAKADAREEATRTRADAGEGGPAEERTGQGRRRRRTSRRSEATKADAPSGGRAPTEAPKESAPLRRSEPSPKPSRRCWARPRRRRRRLRRPRKSPPAPSSAPAPAAVAPPAASPSAQGDAVAGFSVQLAAFADDKGANALANKLKKAGYAAYTEPLETSKGTLWRVRVGPYPSREAAAPAGTS